MQWGIAEFRIKMFVETANPLILHDEIGARKPYLDPLPPPETAYGYKTPPQDSSAKACINVDQTLHVERFKPNQLNPADLERQTHTHGVKTRVPSPLKHVLHHKYGNDALQDLLQRYADLNAKKDYKKPIIFTDTKTNKLRKQVNENYAQRTFNDVEEPQFKMSRFKDVAAKVDTKQPVPLKRR